MAIAEIRVIVSSKKLYEVLQSLEGKCLQPPVVVTASGVNGEQPKKKAGMTAPQAVTDLLSTKKNGDVLVAKEIRQFILNKGVAKTAVYYGIQKHIDDGHLKPAGNAKYKVVK